ncbi:MAG: hypothetical protein IKW85_12160 [Muribaculaceae bacterium]|nr:hypothetical protein [Muribaculaceae bacterium]
MKFKFLTILLAVAVAFAFTSCDDKSKSKSKSKSDKESVEDEDEDEDDESTSRSKSRSISEDEDEIDFEDAADYELTGDPAKDAKMAAEEMVDLMNNVEINSEADVKNLEKELNALKEKYEGFYRNKGELQNFNDALDQLENDPVIKRKIEKAMNRIQTEAMKFIQ